VSSPTEAKLVSLQRRLDRTLEELGDYVEEIRRNGAPRDYRDLVSLYTSLISQERRFALSQMYLSEPLAAAAERLVENPEDSFAASELTTLLKSV
jgi:hypothetical protein